MKTSKNFTQILLIPILAISLIISACATDINSNSYSDTHVGEAAKSYRGKIVKVRQVKVGPDQLEKSKTGTLAGGVGGAMLGSQFGSGSGKLLMTAGGAIAGAVGGAYAEKALKTQDALELTVELKNGELRTIVQGKNETFRKGEKVLLMIYENGRSKISKDNS